MEPTTGQPGSSDTFQCRITSDPTELAPIRRQVERMAEEHGFDAAARDEIGLCVNEALANVIRHAYNGRTDRPIELSAEASDEAVQVSIRDWGNGVNPSCIVKMPTPDSTPGGLGLMCLRKMMDVVEFQPQPDGMRLVLVKYRRP